MCVINAHCNAAIKGIWSYDVIVNWRENFQKNVNKLSTAPEATKFKDRLYLDCSTLVEAATGQKSRKTWRLMVKEWTGYKITDFFPSKSAMVEPTCQKQFSVLLLYGVSQQQKTNDYDLSVLTILL